VVDMQESETINKTKTRRETGLNFMSTPPQFHQLYSNY
jgi:hypothetical protein